MRKPCYDRALTGDPSQQNYVSHFYFLHLIRVSLANIAMSSSPSDAIFLPNSGKFPFTECGVTRIFRVEITSRSSLCLECYKLFRGSHLNVPHNAGGSPSFSSHIMHYPSKYEETLPLDSRNVTDFQMTFGSSDSIFFGSWRTFWNRNFIFLRYTHTFPSSRFVPDPKFTTKVPIPVATASSANFSARPVPPRAVKYRLAEIFRQPRRS